MKLLKKQWFILLLILVSGLVIETGVVLINTDMKWLSALCIILGGFVFFFGLTKLK